MEDEEGRKRGRRRKMGGTDLLTLLKVMPLVGWWPSWISCPFFRWQPFSIFVTLLTL